MRYPGLLIEIIPHNPANEDNQFNLCIQKIIQYQQKNGQSKMPEKNGCYYVYAQDAAIGLIVHYNGHLYSYNFWKSADEILQIIDSCLGEHYFGVSTDYLLKDEIEETEYIDFSKDTAPLRRVSMEEANAFLSVKAITSKSIAFATFLCILSPICMLVLGTMSETPKYGLSDNVAGGIGMII